LDLNIIFPTFNIISKCILKKIPIILKKVQLFDIILKYT
jgi:hypothetical protein